jgi:adenylosuccinate lyase
MNSKSYLSPFSWRYGSDKMRQIFSEEYKYQLWRKVWVALAQAQHKAGLVSKVELADLKKHQNNIDIDRILEIEKETKHDVVAAIKEYAEKTKIGGGKIHLGATSTDIIDNTDTIRIQKALLLTEKGLVKNLKLFATKIDKYVDTPCIGYTHLQPAEPTTVGYRLAFYAQDLLNDLEHLQFAKSKLYGKGFKGAVGTSASYAAALKGTDTSPSQMEREIMKSLGIKPTIITSQVPSRKIDFIVLSCLASITSSLAKFAGDLRILQSPSFGEWSEPFAKKQTGSSAMPFKKNPISAENICSLARYVVKLPQIALENASLSYLERTLDDSANRRIIIPEAFLATDQILTTSQKIIKSLAFNNPAIKGNLEKYAPFAATEAILMEAVKNGANRQEIHELLREISMNAWKDIKKEKPNPMKNLITGNKHLTKYVKLAKIDNLLNVSNHVGDAPKRARKLVKRIQKAITNA